MTDFDNQITTSFFGTHMHISAKIMLTGLYFVFNRHCATTSRYYHIEPQRSRLLYDMVDVLSRHPETPHAAKPSIRLNGGRSSHIIICLIIIILINHLEYRALLVTVYCNQFLKKRFLQPPSSTIRSFVNCCHCCSVVQQ